jgi:ribosomal protein L17
MLNQKVSFDQFGCNLFQVEQIQSRSRGAATLKELVEQDMANNTVKAADSNTTILLRLMRALQVVKVLFEQLLKGR